MPNDQIQAPAPAIPGDLRVVLRCDGTGPRVEFAATIRTTDEAATVGVVLESVAGIVGVLNPSPVPFDREESPRG